ncbi:BN159_2729 family protein [Streptomyces sp. NPDC005435]|uniref:BN159_2729 family protein n=1 Tax=Streptomyces sp. NPDC005435 TaxID=3154464 RepID=UPI003452B5E3
MTDDFGFVDRAGIEDELADRLARVARAFVAELRAQGRLVEPGTAARGEDRRPERPPERVVHLTPRQGPAHLQPVVDAADLAAPAQAVTPVVSPVPEPEAQPVPAPAAPVMPAARETVFVPDPAAPPASGASDPEFVPAREMPVPAMSPALAAEAPPDPAARLEPVPAPPAGMLRGAITLPHTRRHLSAPPPEDPAPVPGPVSGSAPGPVAERPEQPPSEPADDIAPPVLDAGEEAGGPLLLADRLKVESAGRLEVTHITADAQRVGVHIHALGLADWEYWLTVIGVPPDARTLRVGDAEVVTGRIEGTEVRLTAHEVPRLLDEASRTLVTPYRLGGRVYDLARALADRHGRSWRYLGRDGEDGTPLLALSGTDGPPMPLGTLAATHGPLT